MMYTKSLVTGVLFITVFCTLLPLIFAQPGENCCLCPWKFRPVCGSDGITYDNYCKLRCAQSTKPLSKIKYLHVGECDTTRIQVPCFCSKDRVFIKPICEYDPATSREITFRNECYWRCARREDRIKYPTYEGVCRSQRGEDSGHRKWSPWKVPSVIQLNAN